MTHVVAEPCFACKYTDCVVVCPVECFYEGEKMLYIHPDECIDCEACVPECPVEAIFHEDNETMIRAVQTGKNPTMKLLHRVHRVALGTMHERLAKEETKENVCSAMSSG